MGVIQIQRAIEGLPEDSRSILIQNIFDQEIKRLWEKIEDHIDAKAALRSLQDKGKNVSWEAFKKQWHEKSHRTSTSRTKISKKTSRR